MIAEICAVPANTVSRIGERVGTTARNNSPKFLKAIHTFSLVIKECTSSYKWDSSRPLHFPGSLHTTFRKAKHVCCPASQVASLDASGHMWGHSQYPQRGEGDLGAKGLAGRASVGSRGSSSPPPAAQAVDAAEERRTGAVAVHPAANSKSGSNAGQRW